MFPSYRINFIPFCSENIIPSEKFLGNVHQIKWNQALFIYNNDSVGIAFILSDMQFQSLSRHHLKACKYFMSNKKIFFLIKHTGACYLPYTIIYTPCVYYSTEEVKFFRRQIGRDEPLWSNLSIFNKIRAVKRTRCQPWKRNDKWQIWLMTKSLGACLRNNWGVNPKYVLQMHNYMDA